MSIHIPVLVSETLSLLSPQLGEIWVDGTFGGGGHARRFADAVGTAGRVIALDRDPVAVDAVNSWADGNQGSLRPIVANYADLPEILDEHQIRDVDGILLDLGLSSDQLADVNRGFSFDSAGILDLRFNQLDGEPAYRLLERLGERHLADLIYQFGEERYSRRIARRIVDARQSTPIRTAQQLTGVVLRSIPSKAVRQRIHPATRTFQALRIAVNEELKMLEIGLRRLPDCLRLGGQLGIISFHSLEDRLVKQAFRDDDRLERITKKPVRPGTSEVARNPRSRSALHG